MIRTFIAILLPYEIRQAIDDACQPFADSASGIRWEGTEKLHITLKFLGDVSPVRLSELQPALSVSMGSCRGSAIRFEKWGFFPNHKEPRILYVAPHQKEFHTLDDIVHHVEGACGQMGFPREPRSFHPHVTVGRIKSHLDASLITMIENTTLQPLNFSYSEIAVMQSKLDSAGSHYAHQFTIPLKSQEQQ